MPLCLPLTPRPLLPPAHQILPAMKLVKYYAWERFFEENVRAAGCRLPAALPGLACPASHHHRVFTAAPRCPLPCCCADQHGAPARDEDHVLERRHQGKAGTGGHWRQGAGRPRRSCSPRRLHALQSPCSDLLCPLRLPAVQTINVTMVFGVPPLVTFSVLVPYELTNETPGMTKPYITAPTAFTMLSLFNVLRFPLVVLPKALRCVSEALNASKCAPLPPCPGAALPLFPCCCLGALCSPAHRCLRTHSVPACPCPCRNLEAFLREESVEARKETGGAPGGRLSKAVLKHKGGDQHFELRVDEFSVAPGELVAVVGRVGAGKSSLLQALMGNMNLVRAGARRGRRCLARGLLWTAAPHWR